jgi:hypothetical protein
LKKDFALKRTQNKIVRHHKLPSKVKELLQTSETTSLVGFGVTPEQQDFMFLSAILSTKTPDFHHKLNKELNDYFLTLGESLIVNQSDNR